MGDEEADLIVDTEVTVADGSLARVLPGFSSCHRQYSDLPWHRDCGSAVSRSRVFAHCGKSTAEACDLAVPLQGCPSNLCWDAPRLDTGMCAELLLYRLAFASVTIGSPTKKK